MKTKPVMIMVAPNGARLLKDKQPAVPISPQEIAEDVLACAEAGASMAHFHVRDEHGQPSDDIERYRQVMELVKPYSDIVLQLSLGTIGFSVDQALAPLALNPEMVSFPMRDFASTNGEIPDDVREMAVKIKASGVVPELDIAGSETIEGALRLIREGLAANPVCFGVNVKEPATMLEGMQRIWQFIKLAGPDTNWWITKGGKFDLKLRALAISLGGHVRVGFEDSINDYHTGELAPSNASQVRKIVELCRALGRPIAKPSDVRSLLNSR